MLVLFETPAGYALFKLAKGAKLKDADMSDLFATPEAANNMVRSPTAVAREKRGVLAARMMVRRSPVLAQRLRWRPGTGEAQGVPQV